MEKTLHVFGCSYTQNYDENKISNYTKYKIWKGGKFPPTWSELLSQKLNYKLVNHGVGAIGNQTIFRKFAEHANEYKPGDMVIFQWSYIHRYDWANPHDGKFFTFGTGPILSGSIISTNTHEEIILNRTLKPYYDEIYILMNLIDDYSKSKGFDLYFWSGDYDLIYKDEKIVNKYGRKILCADKIELGKTIFSLIFELGGETIMKETNNQIMDGHLAESGHRVQSDLFYEHIRIDKNI